jgi:hypothetical protein
LSESQPREPDPLQILLPVPQVSAAVAAGLDIGGRQRRGERHRMRAAIVAPLEFGRFQ